MLLHRVCYYMNNVTYARMIKGIRYPNVIRKTEDSAPSFLND